MAVFLALVWGLGFTLGMARSAEGSTSIPRAEVWTMGVGDVVFTKFGHAAICVYTREEPEGLCYNYGTGAFDDPATLIVEFLRGEAIFWVSTDSVADTLRAYRRQDRTIYRQVLPLTPEQIDELVARLEHDVLPEHREYVYHHFLDNCTTRVRDHVNAVTGGALRIDTDVVYGPTWRELVRDGFRGDLGLIMLTELLPARTTDRRPTIWEAMFLPQVLRAEIEEHLGAHPEVLYERRAPLRNEAPARGRQAIAMAAWVLASLCGGLVATARRVPRRAGLVLAGLALGLPAVVADALAFVTVVPDLRWNEVVLVLLPTDLALVALSGRWLRRYLGARLVGLALVALFSLAGVLIQPLGPALALAALPLGTMYVALRLTT
jgi:hypothetical protein